MSAVLLLCYTCFVPWRLDRPTTISLAHTDMIHNEAFLLKDISIGWDAHMGVDGLFAAGAETHLREGLASVIFTDTLIDGGWDELQLFAYQCSTLIKIDGAAQDEPNARWNFTMNRHEVRNTKAWSSPFFGAYVNPPVSDKMLHLDYQFVDSRIVGLGSLAEGWEENVYMIHMQAIGSARFERSRFLENGRATTGGGTGGIWAAVPSVGGALTPTLEFIGSEWIGNKAGIGPAVYVGQGQVGVIFVRCFFRNNIAYKSGGAISMQGTEAASLAISSSIFQSNSVQVSAAGEEIEVPVIVRTGNSGLGTGPANAPDFYFAPVWRNDGGPVYGLALIHILRCRRKERGRTQRAEQG